MRALAPAGRRWGCHLAATLAWLALLGLPLPGAAATEPELRFALHFDDAELAQVVAAIAEATGSSFLFDERLRGRVTLHVPRRVDAEEAIEILNVALELRGFVAVPTPAGPLRIAPLEDSKSLAPLQEAPKRTGALAMTIHDLEYVEPDALVPILSPLLGKDGLVVPLPSRPTLVLAGTGAELQRLLQIVSALDVREREKLALFRPHRRSAAELQPVLEAALEPPRGARAPRVLAVDPGNALLVIGPPASVVRARELIGRLDQLPPALGSIEVVQLAYADAEDLAETLAQLESGNPLARPERDAATTILQEQSWSAVPYPAGNALLLRAGPEAMRELMRLIDLLDRPPTLIRVDAQVIELLAAEGRDLAIDALFTGGIGSGNDGSYAIQSITSGSGDLLAGTAPGRVFDLTNGVSLVPGPDGQPIAVPDQQVAVLAEAQGIHARILLEPRLTLLNGDEGEISVGDNLPIPVSAAPAEGVVTDPLQTNVQIERQDVATVLRVRATTSQDTKAPIRLELSVESNFLGPSLAGDVDLVGPTIRTRRLEAVLALADGELLLVGGRSLPLRTRQGTGIPFLRSIPVLGWAVRSERSRRVESTLAILVRAQTLRDPALVEADTIRSRWAFQRHLERLAPLQGRTDAPWAVHLGSGGAGECNPLSRTISATSGRLLVVPRAEPEDAVCDLVLVDFETLGQAARAAERLSREGWHPRLVALPP
ncbi:MAG: hypothetical protein OZ948_05470 [Deltaproteobacteria bacterium]|nr:hypothetical protein [Deltaproteobacteria bacterium]